MAGTLREKLQAGVITQLQFNKLQALTSQLASGKISYSQYSMQSAVIA